MKDVVKQYKLKKNPDEQYGAVYLIDKDKVPIDWDAIIITTYRLIYEGELVHICRVNIKKDGTLEICPEEKGTQEYDWIIKYYKYFATAPDSLMEELKKYL